jgi:hypothetical protein
MGGFLEGMEKEARCPLGDLSLSEHFSKSYPEFQFFEGHHDSGCNSDRPPAALRTIFIFGVMPAVI